MKAQAGIEFLTSYGWALLAVIVFIVFVFYFISTLQQTPTECNFGMEFPCTSYQFFKKTDGTMRVVLKLTNGVGRDIMFYDKRQVLTVENVGKSGVNNYTGNCTGPADIVKTGDVILCIFDIKDKQVVPSVGKSAKFSVMLNYTSCGVGALFCINGTNRTSYGKVVTNLELMPAGVAPYCMDGVCNAALGENYTNCGWDCPPPRAKYITVLVNCSDPFIDSCSTWECNLTKPLKIYINVKDQFNSPMKNIPVFLYLRNNPSYCDNCADPECLYYTIDPNPTFTDTSGSALSNLFVHWCSDTCGVSSILIFDLVAATETATGFDSPCLISSNCPH
ncbi:MAG: hypothetical protein QXF56_02135 [Candidatus Micrarchaeia archaeon]